MSNYTTIEKKLDQFTRKFYTNELIKGTILFLSLGFLYLFFTLFLEYYLWLKPTARTIVFWVFITIEILLFVKFILIPIFKLFGLRKGISFTEASKIIGRHFPEVKDKLLNILQLKEDTEKSDLILASINQKSQELQPIPFVKAIDFKHNKKYIKYAIIPILIYVVSLFTGTNGALTQSLKRVVNHRTAYNPPAPFSFLMLNDDLQVIQGKSISITVKTVGNVVPNEAKIIFNNQEYFLQNNGNAAFSYTFSDVQENINFYLEANGVQSENYKINILGTPTINNVILNLDYPNYLDRKNEKINNSGNLTVPEGTKITWNVQTTQTDSLAFIHEQNRNYFERISKNAFKYNKTIGQSIRYQIASSNRNLRDFENLQFSIDVIKDEYPMISVKSDIDSVSRGTVQFAGQISDDYGLNGLQIVYYDEENPQQIKSFKLSISKQNIQTFFYQFPDALDLKKGINYEFYFQVFDNDEVNGSKSAKSTLFTYRQKTEREIEEELLQEQRSTINSIESSIQNQKKQQEKLENLQLDLQNKKDVNWNDKKKVENFVKRQEQYKEMMQRQTDKLQQNLDENEEKNKSLKEKKEDLKERIEELKKLEKQQKLLDEIQKMADKLNKEELVDKAKELAQQNKQQQRSLEKTLELVKRFYVEQKTMQIANKIKELAKEQDSLSDKESSLNEQQEIKKNFDKIKEELKEVGKDNEKLKEPMELPDVDDDKEKIDEQLKKAEENLEENDVKQSKKAQKKSSEKMKEMSAKMENSMMEMQGETLEEDIDDLRKILENLVIFSFQQENLMNKFDEISTTHPDFGKDLKKQNEIKTYFEHIDDSLYVLSMRVPKISNDIQDDLAAAHYNLDQSLENFSENRFSNGISNQRYVMTATNNIADYLSNVLESMKNSMSMKMGKGKEGKGQGFSLPDLIKKQEGLSKKMKDGMEKEGKAGKGKEGDKPDDNGKPGEKGGKGQDGKGGNQGENGDKKGNGEGNANDDLDGELYEIFKQQSQLRQELQNAIKEGENGKTGGNDDARKALKTMEDLENEILEKGFSAGTLQKMQNLNYELLKLDKAALEQGEDRKRKSKANQKEYERNRAKALELKKQFYNQIEILNRQSLPLQQNYKNKVREYFSEPEKK